MRLDILNWKHFKGGSVNEPFLALFNTAPLKDDEFEYLINNSSDNVFKHKLTHYNPIRECLNRIHYQDKLISIDLTEIDNKFIDGDRVNLKKFLQRLAKYPISDLTFERLIESSNSTSHYDKAKQNVIKLSNDIRVLANNLHLNAKFSAEGTQQESFYSSEKVEYDLEREIKKSREGKASDRKRRLDNAPKLPEKIQITTVGYRRNPDVIVEVLIRANGVCEHCKREAPFVRKKDNSPYLEVHHIDILSEGGEDTVNNAIALCPNCHRAMHFGIV